MSTQAQAILHTLYVYYIVHGDTILCKSYHESHSVMHPQTALHNCRCLIVITPCEHVYNAGLYSQLELTLAMLKGEVMGRTPGKFPPII